MEEPLEGGQIRIVSPNRVSVHVAKFVLGDVVDWSDSCKQLVDEFRNKLLEVAGRSAGSP